jgi:hypothetical protein
MEEKSLKQLSISRDTSGQSLTPISYLYSVWLIYTTERWDLERQFFTISSSVRASCSFTSNPWNVIVMQHKHLFMVGRFLPVDRDAYFLGVASFTTIGLVKSIILVGFIRQVSFAWQRDIFYSIVQKLTISRLTVDIRKIVRLTETFINEQVC